MLGVHFAKGTFFHNIIAIIQHLSHTSVPTLLLALALLVLIFGLEHVAPRAPTPLIAVGVAIGASALGLKHLGVETVGSIPGGFPAVVWPQFGLIAQMWPGAAGIALMSFTETIAAECRNIIFLILGRAELPPFASHENSWNDDAEDE